MNNRRVTPGSSVIPLKLSGVRLKPIKRPARERKSSSPMVCVGSHFRIEWDCLSD